MDALFLSIQISVETITKATARIIESQLLVNTRDLLQVACIKLEISLQIRLYPGGSFGLWKHAVAVCDSPRKSNLCAILVVLLSNLDKNGIILKIALVSSSHI